MGCMMFSFNLCVVVCCFVDLIKLISICHSSAMSKMAVVFCESRRWWCC